MKRDAGFSPEYRAALERLAASGIAENRLEADLLLAHASGVPRELLPCVRIPPSAWEKFHELVRRRCERIPLPYLTGTAWFYGRPFRAGPGALIPRPSTETLVRTALERLLPSDRSLADIGAGTGAIGITLALERPSLQVFLVERSDAALAWLDANLALHRPPRAIALSGNLLDPLPDPCDWIVSNPPYVASDEWTLLSPEVRFEPREALDGGSDGLDVIRLLVAAAPSKLRRGGRLLLEVGFRQAEQVAALFRKAGFRNVFVARDFDGIPRVVGGER